MSELFFLLKLLQNRFIAVATELFLSEFRREKSRSKVSIIWTHLLMVIVPFVSFNYAEPLSAEQWTILKNASFIALIVTLSCFIISELVKNYSQTDKVWSTAPILYVWYMAHTANYDDRMVLMAILVTFWGLRLTYNFSRRGGYSWKFWEGEEDYRWAILRKEQAFLQPEWSWRLFNLCFIALYQNAYWYDRQGKMSFILAAIGLKLGAINEQVFSILLVTVKQ